MKSKLTSLWAVGLLIMLIGAGCASKRPPSTTPLPNAHGHGQGTGDVGGAGTLTGDQNGAGGGGISSTASGIPTGSGHPGWAEDASAFSSDTVYFDYDSASVKSSESGKIAAVASQLSSNARIAVKVEGHCDERGTEEYNRSLGERRALAIREELVRLGVAAERVDTISYGKDRPADPGHTEDAWSKNRRGVFIQLTPP